MKLTVSKRFEFAASHRYFKPELSAQQNLVRFGNKSRGNYGHGHNYVAYFIFEGGIDPNTGMLVNVSTIKERILPLLAERYDHKYLNLDTTPFDKILPTPENIAKQLLIDSQPIFTDLTAALTAVYLEETDETAALARADGTVERILRIDFSAARRTCSPHLSDRENDDLFGVAAAAGGHGHHYYLYVTLQGEPEKNDGLIVLESESSHILDELKSEFDHRHLNQDLQGLKGQPMTTECIAAYIGKKLAAELPVRKVRLSENRFFSVEYTPAGQTHALGVCDSFSAAHRLHSRQLSADENAKLYGKCNNQAGHGHLYCVEMLLGGELEQRTGTLYDLMDIYSRLKKNLSEYDYRHLDLESDEFKDCPSTGENIVTAIWEKLDREFNKQVQRLRLWETNNNRFSLRR